MPQSGDRYVMPEGLGEYLLVRSNEETGGEYVEMECSRALRRKELTRR